MRNLLERDARIFFRLWRQIFLLFFVCWRANQRALVRHKTAAMAVVAASREIARRPPPSRLLLTNRRRCRRSPIVAVAAAAPRRPNLSFRQTLARARVCVCVRAARSSRPLAPTLVTQKHAAAATTRQKRARKITLRDRCARARASLAHVTARSAPPPSPLLVEVAL